MKEKLSAQELTTMALLAALLCVSSYISIPLPFSLVPITAQTLVINMVALLLKPKKAGITVLIWILLGIIGLPVFSGGKAGFGVIAGPTGGYIIGYLAAVILIAMMKGKKNRFLRNLISVFCGIPIIYAIGFPWMKLVTNMDWKAAFAAGVLPFIAGDIIKCIAAVSVCKPLYRIVNAADHSVTKESLQHE